jgi:hypothetical protein
MPKVDEDLRELRYEALEMARLVNEVQDVNMTPEQLVDAAKVFAKYIWDGS